jgi:DNA-binding transcriptional LysR family regulator
MDLALALRAFVRTIERGSITAAARDLGMSQPAVSKTLRNLEAHAGSRLLERSSRALRLTAQGQLLYEASGGALSAIDAALEAVRNDGGALTGKVRLHGPACVGERQLHRIVKDFQDRHPAVSIEMTIENRPADLIHENIDLAVRMDCPADQALIVRRIGFSRRILVAAPSYLARRGQVSACADLDGHDTIFTNASLSLRGTLMLHKGGEVTELALSPKFTTNNAQILLDELMSGRGIGTAQILLIANELKQGQLVQVLPDYEIKPTELFLVYPSAKHLRPTVRAFIDFAVPELQKIEGIFT